MKIAFLSMYSGLVDRGVETYVHELANRLNDLGHDVTVYQNGPALQNSLYKTISILLPLELDKHTESRLKPYFYYFASKLVKFTLIALGQIDKDADIILLTNGVWQGLPCRLWALANRKKVVVPGQAGIGLSDRLNLWLFPNVFVGLTQYQCDWARRINPFVKVVKIPNGVSLDVFKAQGEKLKTNLKRPIVLSVAALVAVKRLDLAIKAVARLKNVSLFLVGDGEKKEELEALGRKLLPGRFEIAKVPYIDIAKVYRSADLFTFPTSPWESFGIALLEAMATNLPVVVNDDPIRREIVGDAGILVNPEDTDSYAKATDTALKRNWDNKPREQAEKFSWDKVAKRYEELFKSLI